MLTMHFSLITVLHSHENTRLKGIQTYPQLLKFNKKMNSIQFFLQKYYLFYFSHASPAFL